jgi:hypothetical protein
LPCQDFLSLVCLFLASEGYQFQQYVGTIPFSDASGLLLMFLRASNRPPLKLQHVMGHNTESRQEII